MTHPIETESYRIMSERVDLGHLPDSERAVVARVIHATADLSFAETMRIGSKAVGALLAAVDRRAPVVVDARMVAGGITRYPTICLLDRVPVARPGSTRSAEAIEVAADEHPEGAVFVLGNAPTALLRLLELHRDGLVSPAAVIGLPVGFVGAAESKSRLWEGDLAAVSVTNLGERGGSAAAAAAFNAILRMRGGR